MFLDHKKEMIRRFYKIISTMNWKFWQKLSFPSTLSLYIYTVRFCGLFQHGPYRWNNKTNLLEHVNTKVGRIIPYMVFVWHFLRILITVPQLMKMSTHRSFFLALPQLVTACYFSILQYITIRKGKEIVTFVNQVLQFERKMEEFKGDFPK